MTDERLQQLGAISLRQGSHDSPDEGMCVMDDGGPFTD